MRKTCYTLRPIAVTFVAFIGIVTILHAAAAERRAAKANSLNKLSAGETREGWRLLFDGRTSHGWRGFKKDSFPDKGWTVEEGCLKHSPKGGGGDIISTERFQEFDLQFEWNLAPGANSGLKYFITESRSGAIGHEYQVIDDARHADSLRGGKWQTGGLYDCFAPRADKKLKPPGEWNQSRILVKRKHVEHWLNGEKILEYELESPELKAAVAQSKFKAVEGFGTSFPGHILLQDHGDEISFRNMKIRNLAAH